jgi:hypothetical protein
VPSEVDYSAPNGKLNQIAVGGQVQFAHNVGPVCVNRFYTDVEGGGYFFITPPQRK